MSALVLLALLGCPRDSNVRELPTDGLSWSDAPETAVEVVVEEVGPGRWEEPGGLSMAVPEGWSGHTGPRGSRLLLSLTHRATGARLELWAFDHASGAEVSPRPREHCEVQFVDRAQHRAVPALSPSTTATCVPADPADPTVQGWYGVVEDREIHVEVVYPPHRLVEARQAAEPLLAGLTRY